MAIDPSIDPGRIPSVQCGGPVSLYRQARDDVLLARACRPTEICAAAVMKGKNCLDGEGVPAGTEDDRLMSEFPAVAHSTQQQQQN
jgi:hypothetical protein